jgi:hypothetical protein
MNANGEQAQDRQDEYFFVPNPGDDVPSPSILGAASWRLVAQLVRRYPDCFTVIEMHPGDDQYYCLALIERSKVPNLDRIELNRHGSIWVHRRDHTHWVWRGCWLELVLANDSQLLLDRLCGQAGLPPVSRTPRATRMSVSYRVIAAFMTHQSLGRQRWECRNGYLDSSGVSSGQRDELFDNFPAARERLLVCEPDDPFAIPAYRFWFLLKDGKPRLAFEPSQGLAWNTSGGATDLLARYEHGRKIWPVVWSAAGHLLP